nr:hypothetical protein [Tanacetum cinerariifolium]
MKENKLEKTNKAKTLKLKRLRKVGTSQRVDTFDDTLIEDVSNQGRVISRDEDANKAVSAAAVLPFAVPEIVSAAAAIPTVTAPPVNEESSAKTPTETKSKDNGKGIMVEEPKPMKQKQQVKLDEAYARKLHEKLNQDIDWDVAVDHAKQKAKEDLFIQRYQVMKKRPQTEAQAR